MTAKIVSNKLYGSPGFERYGFLSLYAPDISETFKPGQFVMISAGETWEPLLRRPFSPYGVDNSQIHILYQAVGRGTRLLQHQQNTLSVSLPLGSSFSVTRGRKAALVAGGVGLAPIRFLADALKDSGIVLYYGANKEDDLFYPFLTEDVKYRRVVCTADGSFGTAGFVTDAFQRDAGNFNYVYCCGPKAMTDKVTAICRQRGIPLEISVEEVMACGVGVCGGCLIDIPANPAKSAKKVRCCTEGPVFKIAPQ
ncbi:MAG: dihydroorotate dehydrogenase electron transfer subunit [Deferribacteraceae bacterium]|nr:dihydroorotate dehydrogenase electron transfer subunit [Deferribacteraceae bacterium]